MWTACLAFVVLFVVYLGISAVTILVIALDSKGTVDPFFAAQIAWLFVMLAQGTGVTFSGVLIGVPALLLLVFNVAVVAAIVRRHTPSWTSFFSGVLVWLVVFLIASARSGLHLSDNLALVGLKACVIFSVGYLLGSLPHLIEKTRQWLASFASSDALFVLHEAMIVLKGLSIAFGIESLVVVIMWFGLNHDAMGSVFSMTNMPVGSRIITTVLSLFWLPNLCVWGLSWLFGAGFAIGDLGTFTLWSGTARDLPPVPLFGIFPQAVVSDGARMTLLLLPMVTGFCIGFAELARARGFNYFNLSVSATVHRWQQKLPVGLVRLLSKKSDSSSTTPSAWSSARDSGRRSATGQTSENEPMDKQHIIRLIVVKAAYPLVAFCIAGAAFVFVCAAAFWLSNGSLGTGNLASVGVSISASTQATARPAFSGLLIAWVIALVIFCAITIFKEYKKREKPKVSLSDDDLVPLDEIKVREDIPGASNPSDANTPVAPPSPPRARRSSSGR
jgi:hypothetical protein